MMNIQSTSAALFVLLVGAAISQDMFSDCFNYVYPLSTISEDSWNKCVTNLNLTAAVNFTDNSTGVPLALFVSPGTEEYWLMIYKLEDSNRTANATAIKKCLATEKQLVDSSGNFSMTALKANVTKAVNGTSVQNTVKTGMTKCPDVINYDFQVYIHCLVDHCVSGGGSGGVTTEVWPGPPMMV